MGHGAAQESAQEWSAGARAAAERARAQARRVGAGARDRFSDTRDYLRDSARGAQARAGVYGRRMQRGFFDTLHEQPLVLGAVGLAVGAAIGAALPATETEDEWLGDTRDRLKERAAQAGREQLDKAGAAAGAAYDAAREEAGRQELTPKRLSRGPARWRRRSNASLRRRATPRKRRPSVRSSGRPRTNPSE